MQDCRKCGLAVSDAAEPQQIRCYASGRLIPPADQLHRWQCLYYMEPVVEDGNVLTAEQLYLIKQAELDAQK
ncbi:hypothetical protein SAMN02745218_00826 [Desulfofundulus australicus DSM 11792]|uniref:Uncharacterized protein n=1 Tax=Desulfofundulus australicus DSM 11792 TaxID=1121425 RepID=A0A1M4WG62_9FIRM|nr:hypothetical protein [Desulfofundulus australicus]SHE80175.1 hypothetical protein SAMN02745218_00826 [Desulfofundulus australicus DSM 11792]